MSVLDNVDAATNLAKNNELQLLVFRVSEKRDSAFYAINIFKTREVVESKNHFLTQIPSAHPLLEGTIVLRNMQIPILNLPAWLDVTLNENEISHSKILICDFNGIIIGLRIMSAYRVIKKNWNEMHAPDSYRLKEDGVVMNDTRLEDGSLCLILDYEKLLADVLPQALVNVDKDIEFLKDITIPDKLKYGTVLIAEDSKTAQRHLIQLFQKANINIKLFDNGKKLIEYIKTLGESAKEIPAIITDIEMPEMSGFTVIQNLKANLVTRDIPIIVNSSMTGDNNKREAEDLGASGFIDKTKSHNVIPLIVSVMES
ncbi:chemotaxis protein CheV [Sulfurimonas sediminis]|uniref:Chemotaxis protein CheV n=1 Tax=Sulfurimonas sediminis TaxID=2590020 RepID=A0A7M1B3P4_9BACT|nr:chemotaxis protein [Sulfurimonas sediminis]QOP43328.1 chemotaxis protein CheV [Sulfurimonas sediminis]